MKSNSRFYSLNEFLRERHQDKVIKLSIDGGFTCPNRDGTKGFGGCIFCSAQGSGDFAIKSKENISLQLHEATKLLEEKWGTSKKYIAYFQSYSNTYAPLETLKVYYESALNYPGIVGLAIATRPDCLNEDILLYLKDLATRTHLWVELGLQSMHEETAKWIGRGHDLQCFEDAVYALDNANIEVVAHMILGFPNETREQMLATAKYLGKLPLQGIKIHMLHILDDSLLGKHYQKQPFKLLTEKQYIELVGEILTYLPPHMVIHRLTGDGNRKHLLAPKWTLNKRHVLNEIHKYLKTQNIYQGELKNTY